MKTHLRDVLNDWPDLLGLVVRDPDAEAADLAKALIGGMASLRTPAEVFGTLVDAGEFMAARALLNRPAFRASLAWDSLADAKAAIDLARVRAQQEIEARVGMIRERARAISFSQDPPGGLEQVLDVRRTQADLLIDGWEKQLEKAEAIRASELEERFRTSIADLPLSSPAVAVWQESVSRCIKARRLDAALFLLEGGPSKPPPDEPLVVSKRPEWFWDCSPQVALSWINNTLPAPPDFNAWRSQSGDEEAEAIVRVLTRLVNRAPESGENGRHFFSDVMEAEQFAETMDRFLGHSRERPHEVVEVESGYETRLYGLNDPRLPCLALYGEAGVRLWLPRTRAINFPKSESDDKILLCFSLTPIMMVEGGIVFFDVFSLLRLFANPNYRRVNFLREIGAKLPPLEAIPIDSHRIRFEEMDIGTMRSYASWLFDILNIDIEGSELVDLMVYYSGARIDLLLWLMRALLENIGGRRIAATPDNLLKVWREFGFRQEAARKLLQPLEKNPEARAVLGAALFAGLKPGGGFDREEIDLILGEFEEFKTIEIDIQAVIEGLVGLKLLAVDSTSGEYLIPRSGIGHLLVESISDVEQYVLLALQALQRGKPDDSTHT